MNAQRLRSAVGERGTGAEGGEARIANRSRSATAAADRQMEARRSCGRGEFYADVHVRRAIPVALRVRDVDVLTAQADGAAELEDPELLDRAAALGRALFHPGRRSAGGRRPPSASWRTITWDYLRPSIARHDWPMNQRSGIDCQGLRASGYGQPNRIGDSSVAPG